MFLYIRTKKSHDSPKGHRKAPQGVPTGLLTVRDSFSSTRPKTAQRRQKGTKKEPKGYQHGNLFDGWLDDILMFCSHPSAPQHRKNK